MSPGSERAPVLEVRRLSMRFGAVEALRDVSFDVRDGDVLALCGDNGAGKSTLVKVVAGVHRPTAGAVLLAGRPVDFGSPRDGLDHGIATIYQDLALAPRLAIYQNVFLGSELVRPLGLPWLRIVDKPSMRRRSAGYLERLQISLADMNAPVSELSGGERQAVAISRALRWEASLVIMDEPTAALGVKERERVLDLIRALHETGVTVILVSHNMDDVVRVANRVVVLRRGRKVADRPADGLTAQALSQLIIAGGEAG